MNFGTTVIGIGKSAALSFSGIIGGAASKTYAAYRWLRPLPTEEELVSAYSEQWEGRDADHEMPGKGTLYDLHADSGKHTLVCVTDTYGLMHEFVLCEVHRLGSTKVWYYDPIKNVVYEGKEMYSFTQLG